jgi:hypothetical protein
MKYSEDLINEVIQAVKYFIARQQVVVEVIHALGTTPDEIALWGPGAWEPRGIPQSGRGGPGGQWIYTLHGQDCRVENSVDGEPIDWHCKDIGLHAFDPFFFLEHLEWRLSKGHLLPSIHEFIESQPKGIRALVPLILDLSKRMTF